MRFFRGLFWFAALYNMLGGALLILGPSQITQLMGFNDHLPISLIQSIGLYVGLMGFGYAYVAERPSKSLALVSLGTLSHLLLPLFAFMGYRRGELQQGVLWFHLGNDLLWLPFFISYFFWYYHKPRPQRFQHFMGVFGTYFKSNR